MLRFRALVLWVFVDAMGWANARLWPIAVIPGFMMLRAAWLKIGPAPTDKERYTCMIWSN